MKLITSCALSSLLILGACTTLDTLPNTESPTSTLNTESANPSSDSPELKQFLDTPYSDFDTPNALDGSWREDKWNSLKTGRVTQAFGYKDDLYIINEERNKFGLVVRTQVIRYDGKEERVIFPDVVQQGHLQLFKSGSDLYLAAGNFIAKSSRSISRLNEYTLRLFKLTPDGESFELLYTDTFFGQNTPIDARYVSGLFGIYQNKVVVGYKSDKTFKFQQLNLEKQTNLEGEKWDDLPAPSLEGLNNYNQIVQGAENEFYALSRAQSTQANVVEHFKDGQWSRLGSVGLPENLAPLTGNTMVFHQGKLLMAGFQPINLPSSGRSLRTQSMHLYQYENGAWTEMDTPEQFRRNGVLFQEFWVDLQSMNGKVYVTTTRHQVKAGSSISIFKSIREFGLPGSQEILINKVDNSRLLIGGSLQEETSVNAFYSHGQYKLHFDKWEQKVQKFLSSSTGSY